MPGMEIDAKSLRIRSTIMTFSARSFSKNSGVAEVPLMGLVNAIRSPLSLILTLRNNSGDAEAISIVGRLRYIACGAGLLTSNSCINELNEPFNGAVKVRHALT